MKRFGIKEILCLLGIAASVVLALILGMKVSTLGSLTAEEMRTTPTPVPTMMNVMVVTPDPSTLSDEPVLRSGSQGDAVVQLQSRLQALGYYSGALDGQYGPATKAAVLLFQQENDLDADGITGA